jgi:U3 small nucleolar ribonucleoprotein protein LCP5
LAEPSIGSGIIEGGRRSKSEKERQEEKEKREYEETNYTRLPKESKKERAKKGGRKDAGYGGEEWRGLGEGIDRIERLTKRKSGESRNVLEKSRKRPTEDGPRGDGGVEVGQKFQKRLKILDGGRRDRGRKKTA